MTAGIFATLLMRSIYFMLKILIYLYNSLCYLVTGVQNWKIKKCRKSKSRDINNINVIYVSGKSDESK